MRKKLILLAIVFQCIVLIYMVGEREYVVRTGKTVYLRTAPIDPRDLFRGDYVRLNYEISTIPARNLQGNLKPGLRDKGFKVYTLLKEGPNGLADLLYATDEKPDEGLFIRGRISDHWRFRSSNRAVNVEYGIESYFVEQGKGKEIEKRRGRRRSSIQIPLEMQIAVSSNGTAIIKGHRWSHLGIGLQILESPERNTNNGRRSAKIRLTLMNASDNPLAIVNLPDYRSFSLEPAVRASKDWVLAQSFGHPAKPTNEDVMVLNPQEKKSFDFDFSSERWYVKDDSKPVEIGTLGWSEMFRITYRPPSEEDCQSLDKKKIIWHGYLPSRAFHGRGNVD